MFEGETMEHDCENKKSLDTTLNVSKSIYSNYLYIQSKATCLSAVYQAMICIDRSTVVRYM